MAKAAAGKPEAQAALGTEARRRRVRKVRDAAARLGKVEAGLADLQAKLPAMAREVAGVRESIERALSGADEEE